MVGDPSGTPDGTFAGRGQAAHIRLGSCWGVTFGIFGFDLRFALVAFDLVSDSIWCEGVGVSVGARRGALGPVGTIGEVLSVGRSRRTLSHPTMHVLKNTHKLKPLNQFPVVLHPPHCVQTPGGPGRRDFVLPDRRRALPAPPKSYSCWRRPVYCSSPPSVTCSSKQSST